MSTENREFVQRMNRLLNEPMEQDDQLGPSGMLEPGLQVKTNLEIISNKKADSED